MALRILSGHGVSGHGEDREIMMPFRPRVCRSETERGAQRDNAAYAFASCLIAQVIYQSIPIAQSRRTLFVSELSLTSSIAACFVLLQSLWYIMVSMSVLASPHMLPNPNGREQHAPSG